MNESRGNGNNPMSNQLAAKSKEHQGEKLSLVPVRMSGKARIGYRKVYGRTPLVDPKFQRLADHMSVSHNAAKSVAFLAKPFSGRALLESVGRAFAREPAP